MCFAVLAYINGLFLNFNVFVKWTVVETLDAASKSKGAPALEMTEFAIDRNFHRTLNAVGSQWYGSMAIRSFSRENAMNMISYLKAVLIYYYDLDGSHAPMLDKTKSRLHNQTKPTQASAHPQSSTSGLATYSRTPPMVMARSSTLPRLFSSSSRLRSSGSPAPACRCCWRAAACCWR